MKRQKHFDAILSPGAGFSDTNMPSFEGVPAPESILRADGHTVSDSETQT